MSVISFVIECCKCLYQLGWKVILVRYSVYSPRVILAAYYRPSLPSLAAGLGQAVKLSGSLGLIAFVCWNNWWSLGGRQISQTLNKSGINISFWARYKKNYFTHEPWCPRLWLIQECDHRWPSRLRRQGQWCNSLRVHQSSSCRECGSWQSWHQVIEKLSGNDRHKYQADGASQIDLSAI